MIAVEELPSLDELHNLIDSVASYPVNAAALADLATAEGADRRVIEFYRSFPQDEAFANAEDLTARSEQIQMMSTEEQDQPWEVLRSPEE
ncbi:MAG TPA: hypothetical protein VFT49_03670 [Candidatus Saccharimonadales bacterium]|nr:hypothetical protein [Candidatus Saccharimonadales bacterium]